MSSLLNSNSEMGIPVALIEKFQPNNDNRWLGIVRDLANPDKTSAPD
jgi:hypothetical protein